MHVLQSHDICSVAVVLEDMRDMIFAIFQKADSSIAELFKEVDEIFHI